MCSFALPHYHKSVLVQSIAAIRYRKADAGILCPQTIMPVFPVPSVRISQTCNSRPAHSNGFPVFAEDTKAACADWSHTGLHRFYDVFLWRSAGMPGKCFQIPSGFHTFFLYHHLFL